MYRVALALVVVIIRVAIVFTHPYLPFFLPFSPSPYLRSDMAPAERKDREVRKLLFIHYPKELREKERESKL